jgi:predicted site-specific integrase-resolvase
MPIELEGKSYYRTIEVCRIIGISRNTLFRWMKKGMVGQEEYRDWRGWRLITQNQLDTLVAMTRKVSVNEGKNSINGGK